VIHRIPVLLLHLDLPAVGSGKEEDINDFVHCKHLVDSKERQTREFVENHVGQMVVERHADLHVGWLAASATQVPLGAAEDVLQHEFSDHVIEGVMKDRLRVVVGIILGMDNGTSSIICCCCIVRGIASIVAVGADCHLKGAQGSATHALSVERVCWNGLVHTQSGDDTIDNGAQLLQGVPICPSRVGPRKFLRDYGMESNNKTCLQIHQLKEQRKLQASLQQHRQSGYL
jgi:hypothetical protein